MVTCGSTANSETSNRVYPAIPYINYPSTTRKRLEFGLVYSGIKDHWWKTLNLYTTSISRPLVGVCPFSSISCFVQVVTKKPPMLDQKTCYPSTTRKDSEFGLVDSGIKGSLVEDFESLYHNHIKVLSGFVPFLPSLALFK